ncbi:MAG: phosphoglucosamine mutase [Acidimicrobiia bacterium]|jgi:phosphoglucosamine mutase
MESGQRLFGTDGVRGHANRDLTVDVATDLARAAGEGSEGPVVIGRDTRRSSPMLAAALHAGFNSVGVDTVDLGIIPVGAVSRLTIDTGAEYGVMVSASHNPADDNGIKFFGRDGAKLSDEREAVIEGRYRHGAPWRSPSGALVGMQTVISDAVDRYLEHLVQEASYSLRGMEFVLDCANGASFAAAPELFRRLGASVEVHAAEPAGTNINAGCGATHPEYLGSLAAGRVGFAFDGDADRCVAVDEDGATVNGDVIMAILAHQLKERGKLKRDVVVATVMSNLGFHRAMESLGIEVRQTTVGDRYVLEEMRRIRAVLGGEQSGHILLEDRTTGDGLRTALRLAEVLAATARPLRELRQVMTEFPQVLENIRVADRGGLADCAPVWAAVRDAEARLGTEGRVLVRVSGTEPLVRVMVEARTEEMANEIAGAVRDVVVAELA